MNTSDLDDIVARIDQLRRRNTYGDPRGMEQLEADVIQALKEFEYALRREILGDAGKELFLSGSDEVPSEYRDLVQRYYKALSGGR